MIRSTRRVAFVTDIVTPYMVAVFRALSELVDLRVVFCAESSSRASEWEVAGLDFRHVIVGGLTKKREDAVSYHLSPRIAAAVVRARPEAVISAGFSIPTAYTAGYCAAKRVPLLIQSDGTSYSERHLDVAQRLSRAVLLRIASACVANSRLAAERFRELGVGPDRIFRAPHSTDVARFWEAAAQRRPHGSPVRVLSVGRLIPRKGLDRLLRAIALASADHPEIRLVVAGSGPEEARLRRLAVELGVDFELRGFIDQSSLPALYGEADIFAFPTLDDPFGMVLLEAAASGLPLIASERAGATPEFVREGETGFVVDPDNVEGMAAGLVELARDPSRRRRMGEAAHRATQERTPQRAAAGYAEAVEAAILRPSRARPLLAPT